MPVAMSHAGWVAIELRHRLKGQVPKMVLLDWIVSEPPQPFLDALDDMQAQERWRDAVDQVLKSWVQEVDIPRLTRFVNEEVRNYGFEMWARAARTIKTSYAVAGSPLDELSNLDPPVPVLHLYAQPADEEYLAMQQAFAAKHPWFQVRRLKAKSHFPIFETPAEITTALEEFVKG